MFSWVVIFNFVASFLFGQSTEPVDRWLVQLNQTDDACLQAWGREANAVIRKMPVDGWYALTVPVPGSRALGQLPCVAQVMEDRKLEWRTTTPNDPQYNNQNDMDLIGMANAWDISTGGLTAEGDTIVAAIIDQGFQVTHPDLLTNRWFNYGDIPGDGQDNDANGFVDDFGGWNFSTHTDAHPVSTHGTSVIGVIGATGNNNIGVSGMNWRVKMMLLSGADVESELVDAYEYVRAMRVAYNNSNGATGAFVVVANLSAGIANEFGSAHPMWCQMYDRMGEVGILSTAAAPNISHDVDQEGDMPTTCGSQYLIAVTNVDAQDAIAFNAGFGPVNIDIGAPGTGTVTTAFDKAYKEFTGTSAAAPHVAGAIALIYSTPCPFFLEDLHTDPAGVARKVRDVIFETGTDNNSLNEITRTGKRLQVDEAMEATVENCGSTPDDKLEIRGITPNPADGSHFEVHFEVIGDTTSVVVEVHAVNGALIRTVDLDGAAVANGVVYFSTTGLPPGIYLVTLRNSMARLTRKVFVL